jgi:hypothetical protein
MICVRELVLYYSMNLMKAYTGGAQQDCSKHLGEALALKVLCMLAVIV